MLGVRPWLYDLLLGHENQFVQRDVPNVDRPWKQRFP